MASTTTAVVPFAGGGPVPSGKKIGRASFAPTGAPGSAGSSEFPGREGTPGAKLFDIRADQAVWLRARGEKAEMSMRVWAEGVFLVALAMLDNAYCYVTYFLLRSLTAPDRLYNIVELNLTLLGGADVALLVFTTLGTMCFVMMVVLVECWKFPVFHELMTIRLIFSALPCGLLCTILVLFAEQTAMSPFGDPPFISLMLISVSIFAWCLHMRIRYGFELRLGNRIMLDISWVFSLAFAVLLAALYLTDSLQAITQSDQIGCPHTSNEAMPVYVPPLRKWYCSEWNVKKPLVREPERDTLIRLACGESFVDVFGISIEPHKIECPQGCLQIFKPSAIESANSNVVGCGVYTADSPVCLAAIHAGALTDEGGRTVVFGRLGLPRFERCSRNSLVSDERRVTNAGRAVSVDVGGTAPMGEGSSSFEIPQSPASQAGGSSGGRRLEEEPGPGSGSEARGPRADAGAAARALSTPIVLDLPSMQRIPQAFHFNNLPHVREFIWLKSYKRVSSKADGVEQGKPWTLIEAKVSMNVAGLELDDVAVRLGNPPFQPLFALPRPGQDNPPPSCHVSQTGVRCQGAGAAAVQLDFCRPMEKECPAG